MEGGEKQESRERTFKAEKADHLKRKPVLISFLFLLFYLPFKGNGLTREMMSGSSDLQNSRYFLNQQVAKFNMHQNQ